MELFTGLAVLDDLLEIEKLFSIEKARCVMYRHSKLLPELVPVEDVPTKCGTYSLRKLTSPLV